MTEKTQNSGQPGPHHKSLSEKLEIIAHEIPEGVITIAHILNIFKDEGLLLLSIFLSLIFLIPISIPGVSTVFGTVILLIGVARLFNCHLWLPRAVARRTIAADNLLIGLTKALPWLHRLEKVSRPHRLPWLTENALSAIHQLAYLSAALLLIAPFGFVPFSNTLPALSLIFFAIGELEKDGVSILIGHLFNVATVIYFGLLMTGVGVTLWEGWTRLPF